MVITLTTTAPQDAILQRLLTKVNAGRVAIGQAALADVPALVTFLLVTSVQQYRDQQLSEDASAVSDAYVAGDVTKRQAIKTAAGV